MSKDIDITDELIIREETSGYSFEKSNKNLTEIIKLCEEEINNNDENVTAILDLADLKELKNILKERREDKAKIKELEEENAMYKKVDKITNSITDEDIENAIKKANKEFISTSVIKEKIEELKNNLNTVEHYETVGAIRILQELLKEKGDEDK